MADADGGAADIVVVVVELVVVVSIWADLGAAHLTALRRTRVGPFDLAAARRLDDLTPDDALDDAVVPLAAAVAAAFPVRALTDDEAADLAHGRRLAVTGTAGPVGAFASDGRCVALVEDREGASRPLVVFAPA